MESDMKMYIKQECVIELLHSELYTIAIYQCLLNVYGDQSGYEHSYALGNIFQHWKL